MNDLVQVKQLTVAVLENGIIRLPNGLLIGRLVEGTEYESLPCEGDISARCDRLVKFVEAIADTCEELSKDPTANLRGGAMGIAHSARKNLPRIISGEPK